MDGDYLERRWGDVEVCEPGILQVVEVTFCKGVPEYTHTHTHRHVSEATAIKKTFTSLSCGDLDLTWTIASVECSLRASH